MDQDLKKHYRELTPGYPIFPIVNGLWQTAGGHGEISMSIAKKQLLDIYNAGFTTFDGADHYGPGRTILLSLN